MSKTTTAGAVLISDAWLNRVNGLACGGVPLLSTWWLNAMRHAGRRGSSLPQKSSLEAIRRGTPLANSLHFLKHRTSLV
ncbi:MAG: hypothetical protein NZ585_11640 [Chloracidobacterium sp.]|nr:hypothetical protein [Chloracidobacterium sp.]